MKTKLLSLFVALFATTALWAYDFQSNNLYYNYDAGYSGGTVRVTYQMWHNSDNYKGLTFAIIPSYVTNTNRNSYLVTRIGNNAFYGCKSLSSITIPNSVTSIDYDAFNGCTGLTSITIPNSVTSIGYEAFYGCTGLTSITIPNSVTSIGYSAFEGCTGLTSITIPNSVTSIGSSAFSDCTGLTSVTIPNSVTTIGKDAFSGVLNVIYTGTDTGSPWGAKAVNGYMEGYLVYEDSTKTVLLGCSHFATGEITIPNSVTSIGNSAFSGCTGLTSIAIPDSVTSIGQKAFYGCKNLTSITIPNSVTSIGESAFYRTQWYSNQADGVVYAGNVVYCYKGTMPSNTSIVVKEGTTGIADKAFCDETNLVSIIIPNSVTHIGNYAFRGCIALTNIIIPYNVAKIGSYAFSGCTQLTSVVWNAKSCNYKGIFPFYDARAQVTSFTFGDSVQTIPEYLCYEMKKIASITIPENVTYINVGAFNGCAGVDSIIWNAKQCGSAPFSSFADSIKSFTFGDKVVDIPASLCKGMTKLTDITIPMSVTSIGGYAFKNCTGLTSITIPDNVLSIGTSAFDGCAGLTNITMGNSVTSIGSSAFSGCTGLTSITIPNTLLSH